MKENKIFGIFAYQERIFSEKFSAFEGKIDRKSKETKNNISTYSGIIIDEIGKSKIKLFEKENSEIILIKKSYFEKYHPEASKDTLLYAYQKEGNLFCGQYGYIKSEEKLPPIPGWFSIITFCHNYNTILYNFPKIRNFYIKNNQIPPNKEQIESSFQKIKQANMLK